MNARALATSIAATLAFTSTSLGAQGPPPPASAQQPRVTKVPSPVNVNWLLDERPRHVHCDHL